MKRDRCIFHIILLIFISLGFASCASIPKQTVELAEISKEQVLELQKSHIRFVQLYYEKLRNEIDLFIDNKWMPLFLSKAVENEAFRKDLDEAYLTLDIKPSEFEVIWKGQPLKEPEKSAILSGIKKAVSDERSRFAGVLLDFSEEAQKQINNKRNELLSPVNEQEQMIINEINAAYADLYNEQATLKAFLSSAVDVKEKEELVLRKLGVLERSQKIINTAIDANDTLTTILNKKADAEDTVKTFLEKMDEFKDQIETQIPKIESLQ
jgi:hypothetical protein